MRVLVSMRRLFEDGKESVDALHPDYVRYFSSFGLQVIPVPNSIEDIGSYLALAEGIILTGGNDIGPSLYGGEPKKSSLVSDEMDFVHGSLLSAAIKRRLPVLGICRGCQYINVHFGGKLDQRLVESGFHSHRAVEHPISVVDMTWKKLCGKSTFGVNSYHEQGILPQMMGKGLRAIALSDDSVVEGVYHPSRPVVGLMWHPERKSPEPLINAKILRTFAKRAGPWADKA